MPTLRYEGLKFENAVSKPVVDGLATEEVLSISINSKPFSVTMRTPGNEEALIRGLLFTEGIVSNRNARMTFETLKKDSLDFISAMNVRVEENDIEVDFTQTRNLLSVASCGICGRTELEIGSDKKIVGEEKLSASIVQKMFAEMQGHQKDFSESGGTHAAAAFTLDGILLDVKEDIGRHNAVDKVIGQLLIERKLPEARVMIVSGRISYEIVSKTLAAGIPFLASVSAPSSLAVDFSKECGLTLLAFCRDENLTVYSNAEKLSA